MMKMTVTMTMTVTKTTMLEICPLKIMKMVMEMMMTTNGPGMKLNRTLFVVFGMMALAYC